MKKTLIFFSISLLFLSFYINAEAQAAPKCKVKMKVISQLGVKPANAAINLDNTYIVKVVSTSTRDGNWSSLEPECPFAIGESYKISTISKDPLSPYFLGNLLASGTYNGNTLDFTYDEYCSMTPSGQTSCDENLGLDVSLNSIPPTVNKYSFSLEKYSVSLPVVIQKPTASDNSLKNFINLLITIGVITPDKATAARAIFGL
jgi:hypothetical protein